MVAKRICDRKQSQNKYGSENPSRKVFSDRIIKWSLICNRYFSGEIGPRIFGYQRLETKLATEISVAKSVAENLVTKNSETKLATKIL